jgi:hypothetical protein
MDVIRLPGGTLRVPVSALAPGRGVHGHGEGVVGHGYVEIGPDDPDYQRLLAESISEAELADKRRRWQADDEALRLQFEEFKARQEEE